MHDKERSSYRSFVHNRQANLQHQLLKTRDQINYLKIVKKLETEEAKNEYETLLSQKREQTLLNLLKELAAEDTNNERNAHIVPIFVCDLCKKDCPPQSDQVPRYHCIECENFDYCVECYKQHAATHPHTMVYESYAINELQTKVRASSSVTDMLVQTFTAYESRPCFGERHCRVLDTNNSSGIDEAIPNDPNLTVIEENNQKVVVQWEPTFSWISFEQVYQRSLNFSYGLWKLVGLNSRSFVGISGENRIDWFIADFACHFTSMVVVPIHDRFSVPDVAHIIQNCNMSCVVCSEHLLPKYLQAKAEHSNQCSSLTSIIVMKSLWGSQQQPPHSTDTMTIYSFEAVEQYYSNQNSQEPIQPISTPPDELVTLIYTSGSTGRPKGSMFTDKLWVKLTKEDITDKYDPMVTISKDPLSHISDREDVYDTITSGGRVGFSPLTVNLFQDVKILSPSRISATPRFYDVVFTEFKRSYEVEKEKYLHQCKSASENPDPHYMESLRQNVIATFRTVFGHRIKGLAVGGAKSSQVVLDWLKEVFGPGMVDEGYGTTEAGSIASSDGSLYQGVQFKLLDVPELGYRSTDKPYARGELLVKTPFTIEGYYNNTDDTKSNFDEEGWFHTGDIVELIDSRKVRIIDRKKNIFKLSQGEFVSPAKVESILVESKFIDQAFVTCGDITKYHQTSVTAIIVPSSKVIIQWALDNHIITNQQLLEKSESDVMSLLSKNYLVSQQILLDIQKVAMNAKLRLFEIPSVIHLELDPFTIENGKMTASNKICRPYLEKCYRNKVNELLESMQNSQQDQFSQGISSIMKEVLGLKDNVDTIGSDGNPFLQSGGDSLSAVRLVNLVKDRLHVNLPIELLFNEKASLTTISNFLANSGVKNNNDNTDAQLEAEILSDSKLDNTIQPLSTEFDWNSTQDILLTGATGFLGSYLLYELLEQTSAIVHCPVRNAKKRNIKSIFDERGIPWKDSYSCRVRLIEGDLAKPRFGVTEAIYQELAGAVDVIYHCGAYVNHVQPYQYHKEANVTGTVEVIKFAATRKQKFLNYISTTSVFSQRAKTFHESDPIDKQYFVTMGGYAQSKWVAELLVTEAANRGFPARIFRPGLIGWSSVSGCLSDVDWLYRLIAGMIALKAAPLSQARMNIIPVDYAGKAIIELGQNPQISKKSVIFHIVNPQDTLWKDIVSWISSTELDNHWNESLKMLGKPLQFKLWWDFVLMELDKSQKLKQQQREQTLMGLMLFSDGIPDEDCHYNLASTVNSLKRQPCPKIDQPMTSNLVKYITSSASFQRLYEEQV